MDKKRWLDNPNNVKKVLLCLYVACAFLFSLDILYHRHATLPFEEWLGFYGIYGFVACVLLVLAAKQIRKFISRSENYYGDRDGE